MISPSAIIGNGEHPSSGMARSNRRLDRIGHRPGTTQPCSELRNRQISWWQQNRNASGVGYYYTDIATKQWESGVDEGIRFDDVPTATSACVDACCHVYILLDAAARWSEALGVDGRPGNN